MILADEFSYRDIVSSILYLTGSFAIALDWGEVGGLFCQNKGKTGEHWPLSLFFISHHDG